VKGRLESDVEVHRRFYGEIADFVLQESTPGPWWFRTEDDYYSLQLINTEDRRKIDRDPDYDYVISRQFLWEPNPKSYFLVDILDDRDPITGYRCPHEESPVAAAFGIYLSEYAIVEVKKLTSKEFKSLKTIHSVRKTFTKNQNF
jgi:hypothetical protein